MCFVFIWEQTATCATYTINWLVFKTERKSVNCAVRAGSLNKAVCISSLKGWSSKFEAECPISWLQTTKTSGLQATRQTTAWTGTTSAGPPTHNLVDERGSVLQVYETPLPVWDEVREVTSTSIRITVRITGRSNGPGDLRSVRSCDWIPTLENGGTCMCIFCFVLHSSRPMRRPWNLPNVYKQDWHWHCPTAKETSTVHNANFRNTTESITYKLRNFIRRLSL